MSGGLLLCICVGAVISFLAGVFLGYWTARHHWVKAIDTVFRRGLEQGKREALGDTYRDPAPLPAASKPSSVLEESMERVAQVALNAGIYIRDRDHRDC